MVLRALLGVWPDGVSGGVIGLERASKLCVPSCMSHVPLYLIVSLATKVLTNYQTPQRR